MLKQELVRIISNTVGISGESVSGTEGEVSGSEGAKGKRKVRRRKSTLTRKSSRVDEEEEKKRKKQALIVEEAVEEGNVSDNSETKCYIFIFPST